MQRPAYTRDDGWGWQNGGTCTVDNTTIDKNLSVTDSNGTTTSGQITTPLATHTMWSRSGTSKLAISLNAIGTQLKPPFTLDEA